MVSASLGCTYHSEETLKMTQSQTRRKLLQDMQLRGFSEATISCYSRQCDCFLEFCKAKDTAKLTEKEFRTYLLHLTSRGNLAPSTFNQYNSAVRFLYEVTLEKDINHKRVPHAKEPVTRPEVLTPQELEAFFKEVARPKQFAFFLNLYGSGLRISEMVALRTNDIDAGRMLLHVRCGKGRKERFAPLTQSGLEAFRYYWKMYRPTNANDYIFPDYTKTRTQGYRSFESMFRKIAKDAQIIKKANCHTLRHSFSTHTLQSGTDLMTLKEMLGHSSLSSTTIYLHLSLVDRSNTRSPEELSAQFWAEYRERNFIHG
jgi:site-specific recombinase XerD